MDIPVADKGLQPERTTMAWARTSAATIVCALTLLRWSEPYPGLVFGAIGLLTVVAMVIAVRERATYRRQAMGLKDELVLANVGGVFAMTGAMMVLGVIGMALVLMA
ncbi:DUF202 domain-containing protein [Corynebacterium aquatimens]|uniref:Uncharacterized membrane protein YidH (DUF202 family) n=1 Tax=Corynebacterium aquatimens TaxID=1190508 RepID=A0A931DZ35_9CORY|nr:DUF202 domain-containing protein [Corynebacterium aquatimens]MBG6122750.1 uncharacterized membrane protein YidH (DUF202 family) [Corynebacterium aquatimens]WJY66913.1 hypothetical protein CAQUA_11150 [Corynebacterium aquatimens]